MPTSDPARTTVAVLVLALLPLAGCGERASSRATTLPAIQLARIVSAPSLEPAPGDSDATAAATSVVRRYFAALNGLRLRMQTAPLGRLLSAECPCRAQVRAIRAAIRRHLRYTDRIRVNSFRPHLDRPDLVDVVVSFDVRQAGLVDAAGARRRPATTLRNLHRQLLVQRYGDQWLISQVLAV